jgi:hypothetical protein
MARRSKRLSGIADAVALASERSGQSSACRTSPSGAMLQPMSGDEVERLPDAFVEFVGRMARRAASEEGGEGKRER